MLTLERDAGRRSAPREEESAPEAPVRAARRNPGRAAMFGLAAVLSLAGAAAGVMELARGSGYFLVARVEFRGVSSVPEETLARALETRAGENMFAVDLAQAGARVAAHPWVKSARLRRELPDTLVVTVTERVPLAVIDAGGAVILDTEGVALPPLDTVPAGALPRITGVDLKGRAIKPGAVVDAALAREAALALDELRGYRLFGESRITALDASSPDRFVITFSGTDTQLVTPRGRWGDEAARLRTVDYLLRGREGVVAQIDLTFVDKVIVRYPTMTVQKRG